MFTKETKPHKQLAERSEGMRIIIDGTLEEVAAFAPQLQRQQNQNPVSLEDFEKFIRKYQESSSRLEFA